MSDAREKVLELDIVEVIGGYMQLKRAGVNYTGLCPIHKEKTPSLVVSPGKGIWKCFGCGRGGNLIDFVMEADGLGFREALEKIAKQHHIELPRREEPTDEEREKERKMESLLVVNSVAANYFEENLHKPENKPVLDYALGRWSEETLKLQGIGYAADSWNDLVNYCRMAGVNSEIAIEAGLLKEKDGRLYDFFRNRLMFPVKDKMGRVIAFSGRILPGGDHKKEAKYINTPETLVYNKSKTLYGLHIARKALKEKKFGYLVEGNPDVIRLHEIGINHAVGTCGTALTNDQVEILKSLVNTVNIIGDTDKAGQAAVKRSAELLINAGITVGVVMLPNEDGEKHDPDSYFKTEEQFKDYVNNNIPDYIITRARQLEKKAHNPDFKAKAVDEISALVCKLDSSTHEFYIDQLSKIVGPKKAWTDKIKAILREMDPREVKEIVPSHVNANDFERYGFYADADGYHFRTKNGIARGCNFTMKPLFHIQSVLNAKRLYEIKNEHGHTEVIELLQKDLVALASFKLRVESLGNFLWEAGESELNKLKRFLYEKTESCIEITQLGWQKNGFYAWANGLYNGEFKKVDENGIVRHDDKNYYLPAFSSIYKGEDGLFMSERRFIHRDSNKITLREYSKRLIDVYGDNAIVALCFYFATLFRDFLVQIFNFFPILNLFGPKGAGKTELAVSLLHFFGKGGKGPNINNTTKAALADHVAQIANGCVHIDEYKNNIDFEKIEFLKGLWDGTGRTRMNMDKDKKKETTAVDCGVILSGQEMPTADIALFSRLVYLSFFKTEYSDQEKRNFSELKEIEKKGLTHITHEILALRIMFREDYLKYYDETQAELMEALQGEVIEDRQFKNWCMIISAFTTLEKGIETSFSREKVIKVAALQMKVQQKETRTSNEISTFWNLVQFMYADGLIQEGVDFKVDFGVDQVKTDIVDARFPEPKNIIFIQYSRIIPLYRKIGKQNNEKILPADSIDYYLKHDKRYLGKKYVRFKAVDPVTGIEISDNSGSKKGKVTPAYGFLYNELGVILHNEEEEVDDPFAPAPLNKRKDKDENYRY